MLLTKSRVLAIRAFSSSSVVAVSSCFGISMPAKRAAAPLAVSHAIWICADSGSMSMMRRAAGSALGSTFLVSAWLPALSRIEARLFRLSVKIGIDRSYKETDIKHPHRLKERDRFALYLGNVTPGGKLPIWEQ